MKRICAMAAPLAGAALLYAGCGNPGGGASAERALFPGANPAFSPDGSRIAFQRLEDDIFKIGVFDLATGETEWVEEGPGNAAYPTWTPDGALIYMAGNDAETAYGAWKGGSESGYGLRIREQDGTRRDLTRGRCRDYTPCVSPDGGTVWFVTTRGVVSASKAFSQAAATRIARISLARSSRSQQRGSSRGDTEARGRNGGASPLGEPQIVLDAPNGNNSGYVQPAVSPDGALLAWGQMDSFFDTWRICGMRLDDIREAPAPITPSSLAALSPRWHPGGRMICFTGFRAGDPGWGVWVEDIQSGKVKRLATGENPCFSLDGASIAYDRDGMVFIRPFGKGDEPDEMLPDSREEDAPESALLSGSGRPASENGIDISGDGRFAFGDDKTVFIRATVHPGDDGGVRQFLTASYAEHPRAIQLYASGNDMWFVSRDHAGKFFGAKAPLPGGGDVAVVAARTPTRLLLSVNGAAPAVVHTCGALPLDTPRRLDVGAGAAALEIGTGWPHELPKPPTRETLGF